MNLEEIKKRVQRINDLSNDDEAAHEAEDSLYSDFITYISNSQNAHFSALATECLKTEKIDFYRWCA